MFCLYLNLWSKSPNKKQQEKENDEVETEAEEDRHRVGKIFKHHTTHISKILNVWINNSADLNIENRKSIGWKK